MKIVSIVGARPEFVQVVALSRALRRAHDEVLVHTGQHYDDRMSRVFFEELGIPAPDHDLGVGSGSHAAQTAAIMTAFEPVLQRERPDLVVVRGDTNSTLACALVAAKMNVPVAHVEAGERSHARSMPEEVNRIVTDHVASSFFCVSKRAVDNLAREGVRSNVHLVGDVMHDALVTFLPTARSRATLASLGVVPKRYVLATVHRADNTSDPSRLRAIFDGLARCGELVVLPLHPRTAAAISAAGIEPASNVQTIAPLGYLDMLAAEDGARVIATDSGGVQREAYYLGVPCVTMRDETEWTETIDTGWNCLTGAGAERIASAISSARRPEERPTIYGDGTAAERIAAVLSEASA